MEEAGTLFIVSTPIGNMKDITLRALEILKSVDLIACEDTRETKKLLMHYDIRVSVTSFHDHSGAGQAGHLAAQIADGKKVALVTDCGTPLLSDPGFPLVREAVQRGLKVEAVPGPSALLASLVASGIPCEKFIFEGFPPQKDLAKRNYFETLKNEPRTLVFYESPHRIVKTLEAMRDVFGERPVCVSREITKKFEEHVRGTASEVLEQIQKRPKLGEMVIVLEGLRD